MHKNKHLNNLKLLVAIDAELLNHSVANVLVNTQVGATSGGLCQGSSRLVYHCRNFSLLILFEQSPRAIKVTCKFLAGNGSYSPIRRELMLHAVLVPGVSSAERDACLRASKRGPEAATNSSVSMENLQAR